MMEFVCVVLLAGIVGTLSYATGKDEGRKEGWEQRHRNEVVCETLLDGSTRCIPSERVKKGIAP